MENFDKWLVICQRFSLYLFLLMFLLLMKPIYNQFIKNFVSQNSIPAPFIKLLHYTISCSLCYTYVGPVAQPPQQIVLNSEVRSCVYCQLIIYTIQMIQQISQHNYKPPRYLVLSLLTLIVFCFPLGLAALVCALKVCNCITVS